MKIKNIFTNLFAEKNNKVEEHKDCVTYKEIQAYFNRGNDSCTKRIERANTRLKSSFEHKLMEMDKKYSQLLESLDHQGCVKKSYTEK